VSNDVEAALLSIVHERCEPGVKDQQIIRLKFEQISSFWSRISVGEGLELRVIVE
jgi:hypothetical protein